MVHELRTLTTDKLILSTKSGAEATASYIAAKRDGLSVILYSTPVQKGA